MKAYNIDFTNAKLPEWWRPHWPKEIRVKDGKHQTEFDIIKSSIAPKIYREMVEFITNSRPGIVWATSMPIGFDSITLPEGATITVVRS